MSNRFWNEENKFQITNQRYNYDRKIERSRKLPLRPSFVRSTFEYDRFDEFVIGITNIVSIQKVTPHFCKQIQQKVSCILWLTRTICTIFTIGYLMTFFFRVRFESVENCCSHQQIGKCAHHQWQSSDILSLHSFKTRVNLIHKSNQNDHTKPLWIRWAPTTNSWPTYPQKAKVPIRLINI